MSEVKLFGSKRGGARLSKHKKKQKTKKPLKVLAIWLCVILCLEGLYFFAVYTNNSFVSYWRTAYINTALSTMRHQWLATKLLPKDVVQAVIDQNAKVTKIMDTDAATTKWDRTDNTADTPQTPDVPDDNHHDLNVNIKPAEPEPLTEEELQAQARAAFFETFWEVDEASMDAYVSEHPEVLANGWENININEAGLDDSGTSITSIYGEQVLAINVPDKVLLLRVTGSGWRGVLAVGKEPAQLSLENSVGLGTYGQTCSEIAERTGGVLSMTASGFIDIDAQGNWGNGNGGILAGYEMSNGYAYGTHYYNYGNNKYKRLELRENDLFYIVDVDAPVDETCTDAMEFQPAMIVDGNVLVSDWWVEKNPRACIGQSDKYEILMLVIEGRGASGSWGTDVNVCAELLKQHGCMQAMNMDGGTSAIMWYDGEEITRCSNQNLSHGRGLPNAWVYKSITETAATE